MNKKLRNTINVISNDTSVVLLKFYDSITSLLRMLILSQCSIAKKAKNYPLLKTSKNCTILANGPSLKKAFEDKEVICEGNDVFVVNMFVQSPEFWTIKPRFYFLVDGTFFAPNNERGSNLIRILSEAFEKVDWEMYLCISSSCVNGGILAAINNKHINILRWNTTTFDGFKGLCHYMFRNNMAMPRCQTVINMALTVAINMRYENVLLYGADHSWIRDLRVNDENEVCYGDRHVYATDVNFIKKQGTIGRLLHAFANMFDSHWKINDYAISRNVKIWNCTRNSYVDAYCRKYDFHNIK